MELVISARSEQNGASNSARYKLEDAVTLGRAPESLLPLDGNGISREHFKLHVDGRMLFITDLSSNGTWLNMRRLSRLESHRVRAGDEIQIPGFKLRIEWPENLAAEQAKEQQPAGTFENTRAPVPASRFGFALSKIETILCLLALVSLGFVLFYFTSD